MANYGTILVVERGQGTGHCPDRNTQHLLKTTSISAFFFQNPCTIQINALPLQQHTYPASRKNSALRVSLFFMDMTLQYYNQPHITVEEQIQLLKSEGLSFENESRQNTCWTTKEQLRATVSLAVCRSFLISVLQIYKASYAPWVLDTSDFWNQKILFNCNFQ